jgi:hypothetical protein
MEEIPENTDATTTRYIAYLCSPTTELRGRRDTHDNGCLQWSVRCSKTLETKMQMNCPKCENRPRVAEHEWYAFDERATAEQFCERQNIIQGQAMQPNTTEIVEDWHEGFRSGEQ